MNGVLVVDKPAGLTSHDVVNRVRRILQQRSVGHLGTLDPMATGVLPLVTGTLTRLAQFYTSAEKTYEGTIRFGFATDTYDSEGEPTSPPRAVRLSADEVEAVAAQFRGVIEQTPPPFSAKKIHGVPAYKLARKHKDVVLQPVKVEIKEFEILGFCVGQTLLSAAFGRTLPSTSSEPALSASDRVEPASSAVSAGGDCIRFRARVASGTYLRSVAHDMGQRLGCGAHLESLRRIALAEFTLEDAHTLDELEVLTNPCHPDRSFPFPQGKESAVEGPCVTGPPDLSPSGIAERTPDNSPPVPLAGQPESKQPRPGEPALSKREAKRSGSRTGTPEALEALFVHPRKLLPQFPSVTADEPNAARIRSGRTVNLPELSRARQVKVFYGQRELLAIATRVAGTLFHPKIVLCGSDTLVRRL